MKHTSSRRGTQQIIQFRAFQTTGVHALLDRQRARQHRTRRSRMEDFWAGRNHAMRRSARVAA